MPFSLMTWRTFFYCSLCFAAALVVASAAGTASSEDTHAAAAQSVLAVQSFPVPASSEPARLAALVFGLIAVLLTVQKAWKNMRRSS